MAYVAWRDDSVATIIAHGENHIERVAIGACRLLLAARGKERRVDSATIIDHSYDFMDFGPRDLLPPSIMVDLTLCHRLQIQLRLNAPNKYVMTAIDLPSRSEGSKIKSRFMERNIQKGQKRDYSRYSY